MSELKGIYALWYRETKVFLRERSRIISSIINPLLWLLIIGGGLVGVELASEICTKYKNKEITLVNSGKTIIKLICKKDSKEFKTKP